MQVRYISNITKEYPDMIKIVVYKEPKAFVRSDFIKRNREEVDDAIYTPSVSSLNRTKTLVRDLVLCNEFELFCTFTFDPDKVDSFNYAKCWGKMSRWLPLEQWSFSRENLLYFVRAAPLKRWRRCWFHCEGAAWTKQILSCFSPDIDIS